jgi:hypothetical protein
VREDCKRGCAGRVDCETGQPVCLGLRAKNCRTGEVLADEQAQAARKEDVLNALSEIASKFRARVGESLTTIVGGVYLPCIRQR